MNLATSQAGQAFKMSDWRQGIQARRQIIRSIVIRATVQGEPLDSLVDEFKRAIGYFRFSERDKNLIQVITRDIRTIVHNWDVIPMRDKEAFERGEIVPSTFAKKVRTQLV